MKDSNFNEFSVYQFFKDPPKGAGNYERVREFVSADEAVEAFAHYTNNVACKMGIISRVIITDGGDSICMEWTHHKGITYPHQVSSQSEET